MQVHSGYSHDRIAQRSRNSHGPGWHRGPCLSRPFHCSQSLGFYSTQSDIVCFMRPLKIIAAVLYFSLATGVQAQSLDSAMRTWEALPENPAMREVCSTTLRYSTAIANLRNQGATLPKLLRWAEQEAERSAADLPSEPLLPIGTMLILTTLIRESYLGASVYQQIKGGFPQFAYRSCLKGKPIDR
jgi:hypothetical protein